MWIQKVNITKFVEVHGKRHIDSIIMERPIEITLNNTVILDSTYTPSKEKEFGIGYALCKGFIHTKEDVTAIKIEPPHITMTITPTLSEKKTSTEVASINLLHVCQLTGYFQEKAMLFKDTAISESAGIARRDKILAFAEDICRLNALYKVVGTALLEDIPLYDAYYLTSAKIDEALIKMLVQVGLTAVISRTAPTTAALKLAEENNILIIGFARGRKCNVYTFPNRIIR